MKSGFFLGTVALVAASMPAAGQDRNVESSLIDGVAACLDIRDDAQRLRCSDAAARRLIDAVRKKDVVVVDRDEVRSTRRSLFGFPLPRIGLFGRDGPDKDAEEIDELEAKITRVVDLGYGKFSITIDSGARWNTTEAWARYPLPTVGAMLKIKRAALGSYLVKVGNARAVRAMRVG